MEFEFNKYQTEINDEILSRYHREIQEQFINFVNNVPFIKSLVSKNRPYAIDLEKDDTGKIKVDITNPHILEDMDYFRPSAIHFEKYGCYTKLMPNNNPNSDYGKWMREEIRRCYFGYVRPSDGEWITGDYYFFLNYCPIQIAETSENDKAEKKAAKRKIGFPHVWEAHYYLFHYLNKARQNGHHAFMLARRGAGKSFSAASLLAKRFILGESPDVKKKVLSMVTANDKKYIQGGNKVLDMYVYYIDFIANNTEFPRRRLTNSMHDMKWCMGYIDAENGTRKGTQNEVIGVTSKDNSDSLIGSRGQLYLLEEVGNFPNLLDLYARLRPSTEDGYNTFGIIFGYGCVCAGTKVWTNDGRYINIETLKKEDGIIGYENNLPVKNTIGTLLEPRQKPCVKIYWEGGNYIECSTDHPILTQIVHTSRVPKTEKRNRVFEEVWKRAKDIKIGDRIIEGRIIDAFGKDTLTDARLIGMLIGEGTYKFNNTHCFSNEDAELLDYIKSKYNWSYADGHITKNGKQYEEIRVKDICPLLRSIGIYGQTKTNKRLPINYQTLTKEDTSLLLAGLFDTDGCITVKGQDSRISLTQCTREILEEVQLLLRKFGILSHIVKNKPSIKEGRKDKNPWYILIISGRLNVLLFHNNIPLLQKHKVSALKSVIDWFNTNKNKKEYNYANDKIIVHRVTKIEYIGIQTIYNLSAEQSHTYLANNIVTHNTSGSEESDFSAAKEIMYNPQGYNMQEVKNVYDIEGKGRSEFTYFLPSYLNRANCYDSNGNSDVIKALLEILQDRFKIKYHTTELNAITKRIAEYPITPAEAILKANRNLFPATELTERLTEIDNNPAFYHDVYIGDLVQGKDGKIEFKPSTDIPIRDYPLKDNKAEGALEIYELPQHNGLNNEIPQDRYIIGHDPVDADESGSVSLSSTFVLDLFTDRIVAEYTGRKLYADDNFEILRKLCLFYNAKCLYEQNIKGCFSYFSQKNCLHLLADTPEYLVDKQLVKAIGYGNTSKGVRATLPVNNYANKLIQQWLLKPVIKTQKLPNGEEQEITVYNLFTLKGRALLKELIDYDNENNFDRVRALGLVMLYREQLMVLYQGDVTNKTYIPKDYIGNDEFFNRNYRNTEELYIKNFNTI